MASAFDQHDTASASAERHGEERTREARADDRNIGVNLMHAHVALPWPQWLHGTGGRIRDVQGTGRGGFVVRCRGGRGLHGIAGPYHHSLHVAAARTRGLGAAQSLFVWTACDRSGSRDECSSYARCSRGQNSDRKTGAPSEMESSRSLRQRNRARRTTTSKRDPANDGTRQA